jgi:hypothetical protein
MQEKIIKYFEDKQEALNYAKEVKGTVIYSIGPGEESPRNATRWGYWVEKPCSMIRAWEKVVWQQA